MTRLPDAPDVFVCLRHWSGCVRVVVPIHWDHVSNLRIRVFLEIDVRARLQLLDHRVRKHLHPVFLLEYF